MHFHFPFSAGDILWTLTFAAHLVLLVVLMGRDRIKRFPWFTASVVILALRILTIRLLVRRMPEMTLNTIIIVMADIGAVVGLLVVIEIARRAFAERAAFHMDRRITGTDGARRSGAEVLGPVAGMEYSAGPSPMAHAAPAAVDRAEDEPAGRCRNYCRRAADRAAGQPLQGRLAQPHPTDCDWAFHRVDRPAYGPADLAECGAGGHRQPRRRAVHDGATSASWGSARSSPTPTAPFISPS